MDPLKEQSQMVLDKAIHTSKDSGHVESAELTDHKVTQAISKKACRVPRVLHATDWGMQTKIITHSEQMECRRMHCSKGAKVITRLQRISTESRSIMRVSVHRRKKCVIMPGEKAQQQEKLGVHKKSVEELTYLRPFWQQFAKRHCL